MNQARKKGDKAKSCKEVTSLRFVYQLSNGRASNALSRKQMSEKKEKMHQQNKKKKHATHGLTLMLEVMVMMMEKVMAGIEEIFFTDESIVVQDVQLFTRRQRLSTNQTGEAVHVEDAGSRTPYQIGGKDAFHAAGALCPEFPVGMNEIIFHIMKINK